MRNRVPHSRSVTSNRPGPNARLSNSDCTKAGDGTFGAAQIFKVNSATSYELSAGDLNGDGAPDIISEDLTSSLSVLSNGTTAAATLTDIAVPGSSTDTENVAASYTADSRYGPSRSKPIRVAGSGTGPISR